VPSDLQGEKQFGYWADTGRNLVADTEESGYSGQELAFSPRWLESGLRKGIMLTGGIQSGIQRVRRIRR
jgi:hypothetical protein